MPQNIQTVILDFGNVISKPQNKTHAATMCHLTGLSPSRFSELYGTYRLDYDRGVLDGDAYWRHILSHTNVHPDADLIRQLITADVLSWSDTDDRMIQWATSLKSHGYQIAVLSNLPKEEREHFQEHFEWLKAFDHTFFSCDLKVIKPEAEIYAHVIETMNIAPQKMLFLDDRPENIEGAQRAHINGICYTTFEQLPEALKPYGIPI